MTCAPIPGGVTCEYPVCAPEEEGQSWCDGQYVLTCELGRIVRSDCQTTSIDALCRMVDGQARCHTTSLCDVETFEPYCNGNTAVGCREGFIHSFDCGDAFGMGGYTAQCVEDGSGVRCQYPGPACGNLAEGTCECAGTELRLCAGGAWGAEGGTLVTMDCATVGGQCVATQTDPVRCYCDIPE
jgi:hypothetical protein